MPFRAKGGIISVVHNQSMVLFHVNPTAKTFSELTESTAMGFSMVCVMLQAVYTTAEKEFRTTVFLIFDAAC